MRIGIGSDHRGFKLKQVLLATLSRAGYTARDYGPEDDAPVDYPDFALGLARAVARGEVARGILICSTGIGMSIAANKVPGIRAALCLNPLMASRSREHNNANVLCLGADLMTASQARRIVLTWLATDFAQGRHERRLAKIRRFEAGRCIARDLTPGQGRRTQTAPKR